MKLQQAQSTKKLPTMTKLGDLSALSLYGVATVPPILQIYARTLRKVAVQINELQQAQSTPRNVSLVNCAPPNYTLGTMLSKATPGEKRSPELKPKKLFWKG